MCAIVAMTTNTPLPQVWKMTIGQVIRYIRCLHTLMPLINPFAVPPEKPITDPRMILLSQRHMGLPRAEDS